MKLLTVSIFSLFMALASTGSAQDTKEYTSYGEAFNPVQSMTVGDFEKKMQSVEEWPNIVLQGEISEVCQKEGCWMRMKSESGEDIFVRFKDHSFLIPKDLSGHHAFVLGSASKKTISVDAQKHYAEDAGKSPEEIAQIVEPKTTLTVEAIGVMIK